MGDRCWLQLVIHGHVRRVPHLLDIVGALIEEGFRANPEIITGHDEDAARDAFFADFASVDEKYPNPVFEMEECNYANIDKVEQVLTKCKVAWQVSHSAGGEYAAGNRSWHPRWGYSESGENCIDIGALRYAMKEKRTKAVLRELIRQHDRANGVEFPSFSLAPAVERWLAIRTAAAALRIPTK